MQNGVINSLAAALALGWIVFTVKRGELSTLLGILGFGPSDAASGGGLGATADAATGHHSGVLDEAKNLVAEAATVVKTASNIVKIF